jgi:hypothetical protein
MNLCWVLSNFGGMGFRLIWEIRRGFGGGGFGGMQVGEVGLRG